MNKVLTKAEPTVANIVVPHTAPLVINGDYGKAALYQIRGDATNISGNIEHIHGDVSNISGDVSHIVGDVSNLTGDATGIVGCANGLCGNLDTASLTEAERQHGLAITNLIK